MICIATWSTTDFFRKTFYKYKKIKLPNNQQDRDMIARELLVKFQMSPNHPLVDLKKAYLKF